MTTTTKRKKAAPARKRATKTRTCAPCTKRKRIKLWKCRDCGDSTCEHLTNHKIWAEVSSLCNTGVCDDCKKAERES